MTPRPLQIDSPPQSVVITRFTSTKTTSTQLAIQAGAGDLNGDGKADLAFGARSSALEGADPEYRPGRIYVLFGGAPFEGTVDVERAGQGLPGFIFEGDEDSSGLGVTLAFPGDVNGDGLGDLLAGARSGLGWRPSWAYLILGADKVPALLTVNDILGGHGARFTGRGSAAYTGEAIAAPGDLNGDGLADVLIGAPGAVAQKGEAYLVYGRTSLESDVLLADIAKADRGVVFSYETDDDFGAAGAGLAALDLSGDGTRDIVIGAPSAGYLGIPGVGKVFVIEGGAIEPALRPLGEIEAGTLQGGLITQEIALESVEIPMQSLGASLAVPGDVNGDGLEDLLVSAPSFPASFNDNKAGWVHLVYGRGGVHDPLRLERIEPRTAAVAGGQVLTLVGAGLDGSVEVRIGGVIAPVQRAITSARLVVTAPPLAQTGPADVTAVRGGEAVTLAAGVEYVARLFPGIDVLALARDRKGAIVHGRDRDFGRSPVLIDLDRDGLADVVTPSGTGSVVIVHGSNSAREIDLPDLDAGEELDGISNIRAFPGTSCAAAGDVNGDGMPDLAVFDSYTGSAVAILFAGDRLPTTSDLGTLVDEGRGASILNGGPLIRAVAGAGDLDGDGTGDLAVSVGDHFAFGYAVYLVRGSTSWPHETFLQDSPRLTSTVVDDKLGASLTVPGDIDGDGLLDLLIGTPGVCCRDEGNAYLIFAGSWMEPSETVQALLARGDAARFDAFRPRDGLGYVVCAPGDMNGDGIPDLALSAEKGGLSQQGESYVVFGGPDLRRKPDGVVLAMQDLGDRGIRILGEHRNDHAVVLAPAGDFNGDGLRDLLIGAPGARLQQGRAYVVFGGPARTVKLHELGADGAEISGAGLYSLGSSVQGGGDFNGDGLEDIAVSDLLQPPAASSLYVLFSEPAPGAFLRGDSNRDGKVQLSDAVHILGYLFLGSEAPACLDAADTTDDGKIDLTDAVYVLGHLFLGGPAPLEPFPKAGTDPTPDSLSCVGAK